MTPWNPNRSIDAEEGVSSLQFECMEGNIHWFHGAKLVGPSLETEEDETNFAMRLLCHLIVDQIPTEGMHEVCQSLQEFYEYYKPAELPQKHLLERRGRDAIMGAHLVRAPFAIDGE
jgi:hypothetical protein